MHWYAVNYRRQNRADGIPIAKRQLVNVGFFVDGLPRLIPWCRLFGHKTVVDGTGGLTGRQSRWVSCDRCGVRANPQGDLDPAVYNIGDRFTGPWDHDHRPDTDRERTLVLKARERSQFWPPGRLRARPTGKLGGQLVIGSGSYGSVGWEFEVDHPGGEHTLAANVTFGPLGGLYLHTNGFGTWLQRRLIPAGYQGRRTGVRVWMGRLEWWLLSNPDTSRYGPDREPWWRHGSVNLRVVDMLLGPKRYAYHDVPDAQTARFVRMPEGDYLVNLQLRQQVYGRRRGRKKLSWSVEWDALGKGIPSKGIHRGEGRGRIFGSSVAVSDTAVRAGTWPTEASVAIAHRMTEMRTSYGWDPVALLRVQYLIGTQVMDPKKLLRATTL